MNIEEAESLVDKCSRVILSCETKVQLEKAIKYVDLAYKKLSSEIGVINRTRFVMTTERSIGFAICRIKETV